MLVIGLTGGIGSGKSTVAALFAARGVAVFDADLIARELLEPGQACHDAVVTAFGQDILDSSGRIDRQRLGDLVFPDAAKRHRLEAIIHPEVRRRLQQAIAGAVGDYCIICVPLLVESGMTDMVDRILVVDIDADIQLARLREHRALDQQKARNIIAAQLDAAARLRHADDIIDNNGPVTALTRTVAALHEKYLGLARNGRKV